MSAQVSKLKAQLEVVTKCKTQKQKQLQTSGVLEYSIGVLYIAIEASSSTQRIKKGSSSSSSSKQA